MNICVADLLNACPNGLNWIRNISFRVGVGVRVRVGVRVGVGVGVRGRVSYAGEGRLALRALSLRYAIGLVVG